MSAQTVIDHTRLSDLGTASAYRYLKKRQLAVLEQLLRQSYYDLPKSARKVADSLEDERIIRRYICHINPFLSKKLNLDLAQYYVLLDARGATPYAQIKSYLMSASVRPVVSSFCTTGDTDFVVTMFADEAGLKRFLEPIDEILQNCPETRANKEEIKNVYKVVVSAKAPCMLCGRKVRPYENGSPLTNSELEYLQRDYRNAPQLKRLSREKASQYLDNLLSKNAICGCSVLTDFMAYQIRVYILLSLGSDQVETITDTRSIRDKIIALHTLQWIEGSDEFYRRATTMIVASFSDMPEYHRWKEELYRLLPTNCFSFPVEAIISEHPSTVGNYLEYEELCHQYSEEDIPEKKQVFLGHPYYLGDIQKDKRVQMDVRFAREHGLILGSPNSGKTFTITKLAERIAKLGIKVDVIDMTGGISSTLRKLNTPKKLLQKIPRTTNLKRVFSGGRQGIIRVFEPKSRKELVRVIDALFTYIEEAQDAEDRRISRIVFIDEAHIAFDDRALKQRLFSIIEFAGRRGVGLYFSTQKLSHIPQKGEAGVNEVNLANSLGNRIIHAVYSDEVRQVADLLKAAANDGVLYDVESELKALAPGEAFVALSRGGPGDSRLRLAPLKIKISIDN